MDFNELIVKTLNNVQGLDTFDCGDREINEFLKREALKWQFQKTTKVYVAYYQERVIGFFTLSCDSIKLKESEKQYHAKMDTILKEFPAIKIGRLAIDSRCQNQGIGEEILLCAIGYIKDISENSVACRFVTVDAYANRAAWYAKHGFQKNELYSGRKRAHISMRFDLLNVKNN